jgi:ATP synthase protein I
LRAEWFDFEVSIEQRAMPQSAISEQLVADRRGVSSELEVADKDQTEDEFQPLTKQEAEALRAKQPALSPWRAVVAQGVVGLFLAVVLGVLGGMNWFLSALYGAVVVVVPGALMVRGLKRSRGLQGGAVLMRFALWELAKLLLAVALMVAAPKVVNDLSWLVLLLAMVVCLKVNWAVLLFDQRRSVQRSTI